MSAIKRKPGKTVNKKKIFNDPVYGFISFPFEILYDIINHPYFQRLRRIGQMGLSHYVYPGALHTRFHHALGSLHLTTQAIQVLREKDIEISDNEAEAVCIAILLHDIGHGPFSHALEGTLIKIAHEELSLAFMEELNIEFNGKLTLAIQIFKNKYHRGFLHQLVSSQLDMDRMDYLNRDSFFTGVAEGVIGYDRIIKMLSVFNDELVVEEKAIYSIEKFLMARRLMYWQVYLHKTSIIAEQMLIHFMSIFKLEHQKNPKNICSQALEYFLEEEVNVDLLRNNRKDIIHRYAELDDYDIYHLLKSNLNSDIFELNFIAKGLINRQLFKIQIQDIPFTEDQLKKLYQNISEGLNISISSAKKLIFNGTESNQAYNIKKDEIKVLYKNGEIKPLSLEITNLVQTKNIVKYFTCYPKL